MSSSRPRTALVVVTDAAEEVIDPWRRRFDASAVARRIPSHVTILFPLVAAADVDDTLLARLRLLYAPCARFAYELARVETFPGVAWLAPQSWDFTRRIDAPRAAWAFGLLLVACAMLFAQTYNPFIYFIF